MCKSRMAPPLLVWSLKKSPPKKGWLRCVQNAPVARTPIAQNADHPGGRSTRAKSACTWLATPPHPVAPRLPLRPGRRRCCRAPVASPPTGAAPTPTPPPPDQRGRSWGPPPPPRRCRRGPEDRWPSRGWPRHQEARSLASKFPSEGGSSESGDPPPPPTWRGDAVERLGVRPLSAEPMTPTRISAIGEMHELPAEVVCWT